jgi:hypothetical protein
MYVQVLLVQDADLHVCAAQLPQVIVPPQPVGTAPHAFAGQARIGWQQPLTVQTWVPVQQALPLQQR